MLLRVHYFMKIQILHRSGSLFFILLSICFIKQTFQVDINNNNINKHNKKKQQTNNFVLKL